MESKVEVIEEEKQKATEYEVEAEDFIDIYLP